MPSEPPLTEFATDGRPFEVIDSRTIRRSDGQVVDILGAIEALPWVHQQCPQMPHDYAVQPNSPGWAWYALDAMVAKSPDSYKAYFRGYPTPNKYWEAPDGLRYWRTFNMMNRCTLDSGEPPRKVSEGARPIKDWDGPRWVPSGAGLYVELKPGKWWPTEEALAAGYQPCKACQRRPVTTARA